MTPPAMTLPLPVLSPDGTQCAPPSRQWKSPKLSEIDLQKIEAIAKEKHV